MLKFLILFPFLLVACVFGSVLLLPLFALAPVLLVIVLAIALPLLILRVLAGLIFGLGSLLFVVLGGAFFIAGGAALFALGAVVMHLALPILLIVGLVWLIRRASRPAPPFLHHNASPHM